MPPNASDSSDDNNGGLPPPPPVRNVPQHGVRGAYYAGNWVDIEDCAGTFQPDPAKCSGCPNRSTHSCPRSKTRNDASKDGNGTEYDVVIIGAGCIGGTIARELSRYSLSTLVLEAADDVSQGATKGNSGIVHAGYDDRPGSLHARYCWTGNQMFPRLDRELRFGYQKNGSLVLATSEEEVQTLHELKKRGETNGVQRLRVINRRELRELEPAVHPDAVGALHAPDAGNVIPYEFAIALCENAVDNGVEVRVRREVTAIDKSNDGDGAGGGGGGMFEVKVRHWEPKPFVDCRKLAGSKVRTVVVGSLMTTTTIFVLAGLRMALDSDLDRAARTNAGLSAAMLALTGLLTWFSYVGSTPKTVTSRQPAKDVAERALPTVEGEGGSKVEVEDMFTGGSGSWNAVNGETVGEETIRAKYVVNCAGGASDRIARMIGDDSFVIKPRLGDYLLLNRNQGYLTSHTLFPCPDPILGKGVLVQTTLWGNLILGPTARDTYKPEARDMTDATVQEYILSKCKKLVPYFDAKETIHAFCGARAKSSRGDWIIEPSEKDGNLIHAAGIDSPGLAGSPAIALEVVILLRKAGLDTPANPTFNPNRAPIITPKVGMRGLKMGPLGKNDSHGASDANDEKRMESNIVCKCEKVTEAEIVRAVRRSLPIDSTQAIRKRTRAGMGHCQGDVENYNCECRVKAIIARENQVPVEEVGGRPWPATSTLSQRWIDDREKADLEMRMKK